jgi:hypothetical protein
MLGIRRREFITLLGSTVAMGATFRRAWRTHSRGSGFAVIA